MIKVSKVMILVLGCLLSAVPVFSDVIRLPGDANADELPVQLLKEVVRREPSLSLAFPYDGAKERIAKSRLMADIENNQLDVFWSSTNIEFEDKYLPVRIPIYRGLLGYRIAIVSAQNENIFAGVKSLGDLKKFKAGQGLHWADTEILRHNGIEVVTSNKSVNLFAMLDGGRFDYFPRGIHQPWREIKANSQYDLIVEPHVLIRYPVPNYLFVNKNNKALWQLLTSELNKMYEDGTYVALFKNNQAMKDAVAKANIGRRLVLEIDNPTLPPNTPLHVKHYWFDPLVDTF